MGLQLAHIFNNFVVALFFQTPEQRVEGLFQGPFLVKRKHKDRGTNPGHPYLARMFFDTAEPALILQDVFDWRETPRICRLPEFIVEELHPLHTECTQRWTVAVKGDFYTFQNHTGGGGYLSVSSDGTYLITTADDPRSWDIVEVDAEKGYYKLQIANVGTVASLPSGDDHTRVLVANYLGQKEQWMLQDYPDAGSSSDGDFSNVAGPAAPGCPGYRQA
ncbi:hypothetical protein BYT27DRAFT_7259378 [Phlegmacium glaucopus]|nr:hypothetical protein BYT27DRAFT_7259378 [Phlegmacium glaucopus]